MPTEESYAAVCRSLTSAQFEALRVLARYRNRWLESWTRSSTMGRTPERPLAPPRVNIRATQALVQLGLVSRELAPRYLWSPYTNHDKFQITEEGLAVLGQ